MSTMKSLPHTPVASTATTITATMMAKAFQNNHHKRGLAEMMAPPPTPTAYPNSSSYLDCQSLQSSLKRVRLSSSPGELRLHRDLRHMVSSGTWVPQQKQDSSEVWLWRPPAPHVTVREHNQPPPPHIELQKVESLRLRLTFQHSVVAWIQIPRMYPHRPPLISRIVYRDNYSNSNTDTGVNNISESMAGGPCSASKNTIQTILVHEAPPGRSDEGELSPTLEQEMQGNHHEGNSMQHHATSTQCGNTVVYHDWSPVQRLGDLLDFVITVFQRQHEQLHQNNHQHPHPSAIDGVSLAYSSSSLSSNSSWSRRSSNSSTTTANTAGYRTSSSSIFPGWKDENSYHRSMSQQDAHMMPPNHDQLGNLATTFLTPNRFDVGYERVVPPVTTMDVENHVPYHQHVSMTDL